ncbi:MAG: sensor histidine kinase [Planctomycetota bacterium]
MTNNTHTGDGLFNLYDRMIGEVHIPTVLREVADVVWERAGAERASVYLIDQATQELVSVAVIGNVARTIRVPISTTSLAGFCASAGRAFVVEDAYGDLSAIDPDLAFDSRWDKLNDFRTRDVMCAPATFKGEVVGVVQVVNSKQRPFTDADLPALEDVARLIGYALYHAKLYDDLATLKKLEQEKAQFMRLMAHELKSPLSASKMLLGTLDAGADERTAKVTERMGMRLDEMIDMIGDLLELAKAKSGEPMGDVTVLDLTAETAAECDNYREQADAKGLTVQVDLPDGPLAVRIDAKGCRLVLSNLLSNAIKYTLEGAVSVALSGDGEWAELAVTDSGIGIPEADIPKLFGEFFRASNAKKQKLPGTGVGLAGVKHMVERFGGHIELDSRENEGTTFTVRLPLHAES